MTSEPPTREIDLKDEEEQTDPHLRLPSISAPPSAPPRAPSPPPPGPKPMAAMPKRTLGATGSIPTTEVAPRARITGAPAQPATPPIVQSSPPPLRPEPRAKPAELLPARPPILPSATRFGVPPSAPPEAAAPSASSTAAAPAPLEVPVERVSMSPAEPIAATMLIPRPSSPPPALGRMTDPGGDPLRERLAQVEVQSAATRSIASRNEAETTRAHARIDALEPRLAGTESSLREALTRSDAASDTARKSLEERLTQVEAIARGGESTRPSAAPPGVTSESAEVPLRTALATIRQDLAEHERKFEARRARIESLESRLGLLEGDARLIELRRMTEGFDLRIARIERDHADAQQILDQKLKQLVDAMEERVGARLAEAAKAPPPPKKATESELRKIKGLSPKYQKALTELGITTVAAVAGLTNDDFAKIAAHLSMSVDKVKKLGWVETARALSGA